MADQDPLIDTILGDDFRVVRQIGFGGFGRIYLAEQISVGRRKVALKVLHAMHGDQAAAVVGLKREAAFLALVRSPCFPRILRTGSTPAGLPYFAMELVKGTPLTEFCDAGRLAHRSALGVRLPRRDERRGRTCARHSVARVHVERVARRPLQVRALRRPAGRPRSEPV